MDNAVASDLQQGSSCIKVVDLMSYFLNEGMAPGSQNSSKEAFLYTLMSRLTWRCCSLTRLVDVIDS